MMELHMQLTLDQACPGMILAEDMRDAGGNLLLKSGTSLTESMLASLQRYTIGRFSVLGEEGDAVDDTAARELIEQRLAKLFRGCGEGVASRSLRDCLNQYRLG
jgi:hypothetical protein